MTDIVGYITDILDSVYVYISDYQNPLVLYLYIVFIALLLRFRLILLPLLEIKQKYYKKGMMGRILRLKKLTKLKGIEGFITKETLVLILPIVVALILRYWILGEVPEVDWNDNQIILGLAAATLWFLIEIGQTIKVNKSLVKVLLWHEGDGRVDELLQGILWTRKRLEEVSKWEIEPKQQTESTIDSESDESTISKIGGFLSSAFETAKLTVQATLKEAAKIGATTFDTKLQEKVQETIEEFPVNRKKRLMVDLVSSIWPFIVIYYLLPLLS
tara:strand:+ start:427 stop:1245 length:819 start_codon:yes stop_codon:yes gene_type:complete